MATQPRPMDDKFFMEKFNNFLDWIEKMAIEKKQDVFLEQKSFWALKFVRHSTEIIKATLLQIVLRNKDGIDNKDRAKLIYGPLGKSKEEIDKILSEEEQDKIMRYLEVFRVCLLGPKPKKEDKPL